MKVLCVIPARYASSRFPGKPLALLAGKPVVQWVWERINGIDFVDRAVVATDDERIASCVEGFGGSVMMTASTHRSGTDRCAEVARRLEEQGEHYDVVVNVQGDEPFVRQEQIALLVAAFSKSGTDISTLAVPINSVEELANPNNVKVVFGQSYQALYFSRQPIPYVRGVDAAEWLDKHTFFKHVGIYAFRAQVLQEVARLSQGELEGCESLEQLRWLENSYSIFVKQTKSANVGIDTPADLEAAERYVAENGNL